MIVVWHVICVLLDAGQRAQQQRPGLTACYAGRRERVQCLSGYLLGSRGGGLLHPLNEGEKPSCSVAGSCRVVTRVLAVPAGVYQGQACPGAMLCWEGSRLRYCVTPRPSTDQSHQSEPPPARQGRQGGSGPLWWDPAAAAGPAPAQTTAV